MNSPYNKLFLGFTLGLRKISRQSYDHHTTLWPLPHAALSDNYKQIPQKQSISAGEMHSKICVIWAGDHFGIADVT